MRISIHLTHISQQLGYKSEIDTKPEMKIVAFALLIAVAFAALTEHEAETIRSTGASWSVGIHNQFEGKSDFELSRMVMRSIPRSTPVMAEPAAPLEDLPTNFDARDKWGSNCPTVKEIRNQAQCGSCWAFGAAESASDRRCIATGQSVKLSPQWLVSCDHTDHGCNGGMMYNVWAYIERHGLSTDECLPYASASGSVPACPNSCKDGSKPTLYKAKSFKQLPGDENAIMNEIYTNGPVEAAFIVYRDFYYYTGGVYEHKTGGQMGGHAIKVIGFGVENGVKYWTVANSWDYTWGIGGTFKIRRGVDECGIESMGVMAGQF